MMTLAETILMSVALAMDCFSVSIACGVMRSGRWVRMAILFGLLQALMPFAGWLMMSSLSTMVETIGRWIAAALLTVIALKMIRDAFRGDDATPAFDAGKLRNQMALAVATSIDALAIGVSMACMGYNKITELLLPLGVIGIGSVIFPIGGYLIGRRFGRIIESRIRPELLGGLILLAIALRIIAEPASL